MCAQCEPQSDFTVVYRRLLCVLSNENDNEHVHTFDINKPYNLRLLCAKAKQTQSALMALLRSPNHVIIDILSLSVSMQAPIHFFSVVFIFFLIFKNYCIHNNNFLWHFVSRPPVFRRQFPLMMWYGIQRKILFRKENDTKAAPEDNEIYTENCVGMILIFRLPHIASHRARLFNFFFVIFFKCNVDEKGEFATQRTEHIVPCKCVDRASFVGVSVDEIMRTQEHFPQNFMDDD